MDNPIFVFLVLLFGFALVALAAVQEALLGERASGAADSERDPASVVRSKLRIKVMHQLFAPATAGAAISVVITNPDWKSAPSWGLLLLVIYPMILFLLGERRSTGTYSRPSFVVDAATMIAMLAVVGHAASSSPHDRPVVPTLLALLLIPVLGSVSRTLDGNRPHWCPVAVAIGAASWGLLAVWFGGGLFLPLLLYFFVAIYYSKVVWAEAVT